MKYCSTCGTPVELRIPDGDNRERSCCPGCGTIHYVNPKIVVGTIPTYQGKVLLCKRAIEPRYGFWTLPAGFMELNETTHQGATRETWEEAGAQIELGPLFTMFDVIRAEQVHIFFVLKCRPPPLTQVKKAWMCDCLLKTRFLGMSWPSKPCQKH